MQYLWLSLLILFGLLLLLVFVAIWQNWILHVHLKQQLLTIELQGPFLRRTLFCRDFAKPTDKAPAKASSQKKKKKKKKPSSSPWRDPLNRVYDKESGKFHPESLGAVAQDYSKLLEDLLDTLHAYLGDLRHRLEISRLWIRIDFGTGNPAHTGMLYGTFWGLLGVLYPLCQRYVCMEYPRLVLNPDFYQKHWDFELKCIIKVRPAHIINAFLKQGLRQAGTYGSKLFKKGSVKHG